MIPTNAEVEKHYKAVFDYEEKPHSHSLPFVLDGLRAAPLTDAAWRKA